MKKKTNTKLEVKKLNRMKEQIVRSLSHQFQSLIYDSENMFREIRESIKTIREISKDPTFCNSIPTIEEIDEIHNIHNEHLYVLYGCYKQYSLQDDDTMNRLQNKITEIQMEETKRKKETNTNKKLNQEEIKEMKHFFDSRKKQQLEYLKSRKERLKYKLMKGGNN